jgi:CheY-like chemotaxis protein
MDRAIESGVARVLVVDDDKPLHSLIESLLRRYSVVVEHEFDGALAVRRLRREAFDAIVVDLMLPGMNGFELISELKQWDPAMLSRTVVVTAAAESILRQFKDASLVRRVIRKPFEISDFTHELLLCAGAIPRFATVTLDQHPH